MDKQSKKKIVSNLKDSFENSSGVVVTHYLGLNNSELNDLRNQVRDVGSRFCVTKNSLAKLATKSTEFESLNDFFTGPTALIFSKDALSAIKVIKKFSDKNQAKAGRRAPRILRKRRGHTFSGQLAWWVRQVDSDQGWRDQNFAGADGAIQKAQGRPDRQTEGESAKGLKWHQTSSVGAREAEAESGWKSEDAERDI